METIFTFQTTHAAIAAEQALLAEGVAVSVMNLPAAIRAGCGIGLRLPADAVARARQVLAVKGIQVDKLYTKTLAAGQPEYTLLASAEDS